MSTWAPIAIVSSSRIAIVFQLLINAEARIVGINHATLRLDPASIPGFWIPFVGSNNVIDASGTGAKGVLDSSRRRLGRPGEWKAEKQIAGLAFDFKR